MSAVISCRDLSAYAGKGPLFSGLSLAFDPDTSVGLLGPNGVGKSTLLRILAGRLPPEAGDVLVRPGLVVSYLPQSDPPSVAGETALGVMTSAYRGPAGAADRAVARALGGAGFSNSGSEETAALSGGRRKRLSVAAAFVSEPDFVLLDEPTNHLDVDGIEWVEGLLARHRGGSIVVSHDREFLTRTCRRFVELDPAYPGGHFSASADFPSFLARRDEYVAGLDAARRSLAGKVRRETEWLRRGAKARTTKQSARVEEAGRLAAELDVARRRATRRAAPTLSWETSGARSKESLVAEGVSVADPGDPSRVLVTGFSCVLGPGVRLGVVGPNGSGKTTLLKLLLGESEPAAGALRRRPGLTYAYFDQSKRLVPDDVSLGDALAPGGPGVTYEGRSYHVAAWAARFGFGADRLGAPFGTLSGGERTRVLLARLLAAPADVLVLDEPTNDLDLDTVETLEAGLVSFPGAVAFVTHDRALLRSAATVIVGLKEGAAHTAADLSQWERRAAEGGKTQAPRGDAAGRTRPRRQGLTYRERRELEGSEAAVGAAEKDAAAADAVLQDPDLFRDPDRAAAALAAAEAARARVEHLYARWEELETRAAGGTPGDEESGD